MFIRKIKNHDTSLIFQIKEPLNEEHATYIISIGHNFIFIFITPYNWRVDYKNDYSSFQQIIQEGDNWKLRKTVKRQSWLALAESMKSKTSFQTTFITSSVTKFELNSNNSRA